MSEKRVRDFDGFILPDGARVSIEDVDRMAAYFCGRTEDPAKIAAALWGLAQECICAGHFSAAHAYVDRILAIADTPAEKARCLLAMGQVQERAGEVLGALETYSRAFELPQEKTDVWYFLNNNLAYCENHAGRHKEAAGHCRTAISIDPARHNAYKNLGIALQGLNCFSEAARSFARATEICPSDGRALRLLEDLLLRQPEVLDEVPDLLNRLDASDPGVKAMRARIRPQ